MAKRSLITAARLREIIDYDPSTGKFTWLKPAKGRYRSRDVGWCGNHGYLAVSINYRNYLQHRLAFLWMTGQFPPRGSFVDHINAIKTDNRWSNLRLVSPRQNNWNQLRVGSRRGYVGVYFYPRNTKRPWVAHADNGYIGSFATQEEAIAARTAEILRTRGHFSEPAKPRRDWLFVSSTKRIV